MTTIYLMNKILPQKKLRTQKENITEVADGHKNFFLMTGQYKTIISKKFKTNKYQVKKSKTNITNIWTHDLIKKKKINQYTIKKL